MTSQSLDEQVKRDIRSLQSSLSELESSVRLSNIRDSVEDLQTSVHGMSQRIKSLRENGYVFEKGLESKAANFARQWAKIAPNLETQIEKEANVLTRSLRPLETQITQLAEQRGAAAILRPRASKLKSQVKALKRRVEAAEKSIRGSYDQFKDDVQKVKSHLSRLEEMLKKFDEATFELLATEAAVMAVKAVWAKDGKERKNDPEGVLYLSDQRIFFEQKEKIATKKILFVTTEKKLVHKLLWEAPVAMISETKAHKEGFMKKDDFIAIYFDKGTPFDVTHLHIWQSGDDWKSLLKRAKAKEFDATRAIEIDEKIVEKVKDAPTECPACGGAITQVIMRGMESITCEYCGAVIRL